MKPSHVLRPYKCMAPLFVFFALNVFSQQPSIAYLNELPDRYASSLAKRAVELAPGDPEGGRFLVASQADANRIIVTKVDEQGQPIWVKSHTTPPGGQSRFQV